MSDPEDELCKCGHRVRWFIPYPEGKSKPDWYVLDVRLEEDVVERPCPHRSGTVVQHCPACDRVVGMWGFGVAGGAECDCWDLRPWWRRLLDWLKRGAHGAR